MLETGDVLATWQLAALPADRRDLPLAARRIADHRRAYLAYEGAVSGQRGAVARVDAGEWRAIRQTEQEWEFELSGGRLAGRFLLVRQAGGAEWELRGV